MAVISDHQTLMNHVLSDPGNPEGEIWVVRDAWEAGISLHRLPDKSAEHQHSELLPPLLR